MRKSLIAAVALTTLLGWGSRVEAQRGVDSELFHPALDSYGIFTVDRAQTSKQWDFGFKLFLNYAENPLRLPMCPPTGSCSSLSGANPHAPGLQTIMNYQAVMNFGMHLGLTDWLELVVDIPISAQSYSGTYGNYGSASDPNILVDRNGFYSNGNFTNVPPPNAAPLDWRVGFKARLFRAGMFAMGLSAVVTLPFGDDAAFLGDADFTFRPTLIADVTHGPFTAAINLGAIVRKETIVDSPHDPVQSGTTGVAQPRSLIDVSDELTWSAGVAYRFVHWAGVAAEIFGLVPLVTSASTPLDASKDYTADVLGGFQFFPVRDVSVALGAGAGVISSSERHDDFRVFGGITWAPAEGVRGGGVGGGIDSDGDGIPDAADKCPTEPEDKDGFDDEDGCPDLDNDQDGIADKNDKCPNEAEDRDGYQDEDGCPDIDNDGDGIPDAQDKCPNDPEDKDGFQDDDGCPDLDNDGDGIPDSVDKCPNEPETFNGIDDTDGCPDSGSGAAGTIAITGGKIELPEAIQFEEGSDRLIARSQSLVERVAEKMKANPQVKRIRIEGHTDDVGSPKKNLELSQLRAEAVRAFMIRKGVEADRLQAVGYGDTHPIDKRKTAEARAKNRRVEFIIVEQ
ncbi:MAG TPA: OmpA family protein [Polyangia bacterium]|nr:OmpA family protein [Polyangia bacterium]